MESVKLHRLLINGKLKNYYLTGHKSTQNMMRGQTVYDITMNNFHANTFCGTTLTMEEFLLLFKSLHFKLF